MILVSDHAFISKWWWIGAIRKTRLAGAFEARDLDHHRQRLDQEDAADEDEQHFRLGHDRESGDCSAERHRARVAHEQLGRVGVEPEEANRRADHRRADDREVEVVVAPLPTGPERIHEIAAIASSVSSEMIDVPAASPSSPSVRLTPLTVPAMTKKRNG